MNPTFKIISLTPSKGEENIMREEDKVHPDALEQMLGAYPNSRWAAYQNVALDSRNCGHLQFLAIGPGNTYKEPPVRYPLDNAHGMGWRYRFAGWVNLETGEIEKETAKKIGAVDA